MSLESRLERRTQLVKVWSWEWWLAFQWAEGWGSTSESQLGWPSASP